MKKYFLLSFILLFSALILTGGKAFAESKYAYVDVTRIFDEYEKTKSYDESLQDALKTKEDDRNQKVNNIRALKDELALLNDEAKIKKQDVLDEKLQELQEFDLKAKRELGQERNTFIREIFKDIDDVVAAYGERKGLDFIFNERALLYKTAQFDITDDILKELNKGYKKK